MLRLPRETSRSTPGRQNAQTFCLRPSGTNRARLSTADSSCHQEQRLLATPATPSDVRAHCLTSCVPVPYHICTRLQSCEHVNYPNTIASGRRRTSAGTRFQTQVPEGCGAASGWFRSGSGEAPVSEAGCGEVPGCSSGSEVRTLGGTASESSRGQRFPVIFTGQVKALRQPLLIYKRALKNSSVLMQALLFLP